MGKVLYLDVARHATAVREVGILDVEMVVVTVSAAVPAVDGDETAAFVDGRSVPLESLHLLVEEVASRLAEEAIAGMAQVDVIFILILNELRAVIIILGRRVIAARRSVPARVGSSIEIHSR